MGASGLVWTLTIVLIAGLMLVDYVLHVRKTHVPTLRQAVIQSATFVGIAILASQWWCSAAQSWRSNISPAT